MVILCFFWGVGRSRTVLINPRSSVKSVCIGNERRLPADSGSRTDGEMS